MIRTNTLIVGASVAGLSCAASLQREGIEYIIIEKEAAIASPWRNHYERLHLHTNKSLSALPYKKFDNTVPRYPSRQEVVEYLEEYQQTFNIQPVFGTEAKHIKKENNYWMVETNNETYAAAHVIIATGPFGKPKQIQFKGMETFPGKIIHSFGYKSGKDFKGQHVLVVGFGNSACEIAIDLYEQGAMTSMSVRSAVNVIPRDVFGIPVLQLAIPMSILPPRVADTINAPLMRLLVGNITKLGLKKLPYGPLEQIQKDGTVPLLDIGTVRHIREGHIKIYSDIDFIENSTVHFKDGKEKDFDVVVAAIGYYRDYAAIIAVDAARFEDLKLPVSRQQYFGKDGLYFCGFWIAPTGQFREIARDAKKIAKHIRKREAAI